MKKKAILTISLVSAILITIYGLNSAGILFLSQPEYLQLNGPGGPISKTLGNTDGLLILAILAALVIFIPAISYLRKK